MNGILDAAVQVDRFLQRIAVRYCLIGGIALQRWGQPRTTLDVDVTVMTEFGRERPVIDLLLTRLRPRVPDAVDFAQQSRVLLAATEDGVGVDVSLGALPFESRMVARSSVWSLADGRTLRTCSADDLIVQKAFAGREQDWIDVRHVIVRQADELDHSRILREVEPLLELKEELGALARLKALLSRD
jgi:hypothetical protein